MTIITKPDKVLKLKKLSTMGIEPAIYWFGGERLDYVTTATALQIGQLIDTTTCV